MNIYVSCPSNNLPLAKNIMALLQLEGHNIAYNWVPDIEAGEFNAPKEELKKRNTQVLRAIVQADALVLVIKNKSVTLGCGVELGVALYNNVPVIVLELETASFKHFFMFHPGITKVYSQEELLEQLNELDRSPKE
jgi:hypothetical protein